MKENNNTPKMENTPDSVRKTVLAFKAQLAVIANEPIVHRGRAIEVFSHKNEHGKRVIRQPLSYDAYAKRLRDFKFLLGIVKGFPLDDLSAITNQLGGSFRLPLHLYLHHCLPDYPEKEAMLEKHRTIEGANTVMNNILAEVEVWLDQGKISDSAYAARLMDNERLIAFATNWLETARIHA